MKRVFLIFIFLGLLTSPLQAWVIKDYQGEIQVEKGGTLSVSETILVDFDGERHHGIYRDIPLTFHDPLGQRHRLKIKDVFVTDDMARPRKVKVYHRGGWLRIRIGRANQLVSGARTYVINYKVKYALYKIEGADELYWNIIGTGWAVPIQKAEAVVILPFQDQKVQVACYTGSRGSKGRDCTWEKNGSEIGFTVTRSLYPHEGLTIGVGWPPGLVKIGKGPGFWESPWFFVVLFLVALFALLYWLWWTRGRDIGGRGVIQVQYHPPEGMTPLEAGTLIDERMDMGDVAAEIVDLARRGHLTIEEVEEEGLLWGKKRGYIFHKINKDYNQLERYDVALLLDLFLSGGDTQSLSGLKKRFYAHIPDIREKLFSTLMRKGFFAHDPQKVRGLWKGLAVAAVVVGFVIFHLSGMMGFVESGFPFIVGGVLAGSMIYFFGRIMPRKTAKGKLAWEHLKGYEEFISRVERDVIERLFSPEEIPKVFEEALPYAIAFGEAEVWANAFEGLFKEPPRWYSTTGPYTPIYLGHSMGHFSQQASTALSSAPRSSGSGGGGFSGGGGGGGGGGAW